MAVERSAILACGGFDERFTGAAEDRELCDRWRHRGGRLVYRPEAVVYHAHDLRLGSFVRQHHAYGRGAYTYHRVRAARGSGRMRDDLRFHAELPARLLASARRVPVGHSRPRGCAGRRLAGRQRFRMGRRGDHRRNAAGLAASATPPGRWVAPWPPIGMRTGA